MFILLSLSLLRCFPINKDEALLQLTNEEIPLTNKHMENAWSHSVANKYKAKRCEMISHWSKQKRRFWWLSGKESTYQCRRHRFDPWSGKIPPAGEQLSP